MKRCKVLILAGGGIFGTIITHFLSMLPIDKQNLNYVNVISGCSVGGMLASAYALGSSFGYIDDVFQKRASECFTKRCMAKVNPLACPTYRNDTIDNVLNDMMGEATVGQIRTIYPQLSYIVPALDLTDDKYIVFENITGKYNNLKLKDISGYTSCAPSYFAGRELDGHCIVDAGLIEVVPILTATTEIKKKYNVPFCNMDVFVIGCGKDSDGGKITPKYYDSLGLLGIATDVLVPYATLGNEMFSIHCGKTMGYNYFNYFNPIKTNGSLDDVKQIPDIVKEVDKHREEFLESWNYWLTL